MRKSISASSTLRLLVAVIFALLLLAQQVPPAKAAGGVPELLTFQDKPVNTPIYQDYPGVTFVGGNLPSYHPITIIRPTMATASPSQALQLAPEPGCELGACPPRLTMQFALPQSRVSLSTGLPVPLLQGTPPLEALMEGFQGDPNQGGALIVQRWTSCLGTGPSPITTPLEIDDSATRITYVRLSLVDCSQPYNVYSFLGPSKVILDNLLYDRPLNPPPGDNTPPILTITYPAMNAVITGNIPGEIALTMQATLKEESPFDLSVQVNGTSLTYSPVSALSIAQNTYSITVYLSGQGGLHDGSNTVTLKATDFDPGGRNAKTATVTFTYHTKPLPPPSQVDIIPTAFEVTQTIDPGPGLFTQALADPSGNGYRVDALSTPLIQGKATLIRIYAAASGTTSAIKNVPATEFVSRANCSTNCGISGEEPPIDHIASAHILIPNLNGITVNPLSSSNSVPLTIANEGTSGLDKTWNFYIAPDWTMQDIVVVIYINNGGYDFWHKASSVPECSSNAILECQHNNQLVFHLHFQPAPTITVNPVYIRVQGTYTKDGQSYNAISSTSQFHAMVQLMNELFPLNVIEGPSYHITVSPDISSDDLTDKIKDVSGVPPCWVAVAQSSIFYLGIFPKDQSKQPEGFAANEGGVSGEAYGASKFCQPLLGAWADADSPIAAAHELLHNIGFDHLNCPTNGPCNIGVYGTDLNAWRVITPSDGHDLMLPYVGDTSWISWFEYSILRTHYLAGSYDDPDPPALWVSGSISPSGKVTFNPAYQVNTNRPLTDTIEETNAENIYTLQGYDRLGNTLFVHNFMPLPREQLPESDGQGFIFQEAVPIVTNLQRIELRKGSKVFGTLVNPAPGSVPRIRITAPTPGSVWQVGKPQTISWISNSPAKVRLYALVMYSPDGGKTLITLGRDVTGNSLTINPDELPGGTTGGIIYVQVSDGMNTATTMISPLTVQPKPPQVQILSPTAKSSVPQHALLVLEGTAYDLQEPLTDAQFQWSSDRDGMLGTGRQLTVWKLSPGQHTLTLTVTDSHGRVGRATVQLEVGTAEGGTQPSFDWRILWALLIALLLLGLVLAIILMRRRRQHA